MIAAIPPRTIGGPVDIVATLTGFTTAATASAASGDTGIIASSRFSATGSSATTRTLSILPPPNTTGLARARLTVTEGVNTFTEEFLAAFAVGTYGAPTAASATRIALRTGTSTLALTGSQPQNLPLTFVLVSPPAQGSLTIAGASAFYTPNASHTGTDSFTFRVDDPFGGVSAPATITVQLNSAPVAGPDLALHPAGAAVKVLSATLLANDSDPEGGAVTFAGVGATSAQGGSVSTDGTWVYYTPPAGASGDDTATYTIRDAQGALGTGTITFREQAPPSGVTHTTLAIAARSGGGVTLRLVGVPGRSYTVSVSTDLTNWTPLMTVTADAQGLYSVDDPNSPADGTGRFYRALRNN